MLVPVSIAPLGGRYKVMLNEIFPAVDTRASSAWSSEESTPDQQFKEGTKTPLARNQGRCEELTLIRHLLNEGLRHFRRGATEVGCLSHALAAHRQVYRSSSFT
jgi:hypothetical protein